MKKGSRRIYNRFLREFFFVYFEGGCVGRLHKEQPGFVQSANISYSLTLSANKSLYEITSQKHFHKLQLQNISTRRVLYCS